MAKYNWKDDNGFDESISTTIWLSILGDKNISINSTTRNNPKRSLGSISVPTGASLTPVITILSSGIHTGSLTLTSGGVGNSGYNTFYGQGIENTFFKKSLFQPMSDNRFTNRSTFYDMTILEPVGNRGYSTSTYNRCAIKGGMGSEFYYLYNCKVYTKGFPISSGGAGQLSYIGVSDMLINTAPINNILYDECSISISSQTDVNLSINRYAAFNNCKFKIGYETEYSILSGTTSYELKTSFVARCIAAGYTVPSITEYGNGGVQAGRWIFSNNSTVDGLVLKGSEIHLFEIPRLIYFGYSSERNDTVSITTDKTKANSFSPAYADSALDVVDGSIGLKPTTDVSQKQNLAIKSNVIWLGGKSQINLIDIIHNLPKEYGVWLDSTLTFADTSTTTITAGKNYYVRSSDNNMASIVYNGGTYTSALLNINNVFVGVSGVTAFTDVNGNARVYEVLDNKALHQTIQMRIVDAIPAAQIISGALTIGKWYLVEHINNQSNTTEYVTYGGAKYYVGSSFLVANGTTSFTLSSSNVHLRECWADSYTYGSNPFFSGKQQPVWFDILPNDTRCLMKNNNNTQSEMQRGTDGNYIASGHPDFYDSVLGATGTKLPAYQIKGTYMQLRLVISTQNPM